MPRRKRRLEKLPIAPPPPPRAPTAAEIQMQQQNDLRLLEYLKWRLGPVLGELKKRYKRFQRSLYRDWQSDDLEWRQEQLKRGETVTGLGTQPYHNVDLDTMASDLYKGYYYTPDDFLQDILRIQANAEVNKIMENDAEAPIRAGQMVNHVKVMLDQTFDAASRAECEKMAERMREKEKNSPRKDRRRGRGGELPGEEGIVAAAETAAAAGGAFKPRSGARQRDDEEGQEGDADAEGEDDDVPIQRDQQDADVSAEQPLDTLASQASGERSLKRDRELEGEVGEGESDGSTSKKQRMDLDDPAQSASSLGSAPQVASELQDGQAVASTSNAFGPVAAPVLLPETAQSSSFASLLNPPAPSTEFATVSAAMAPPMAVGSAPLDAPGSAPALVNGLPSGGPSGSALSGPIATLDAGKNPFLADTQMNGTGGPPPIARENAENGASAASSRVGTPTPAANGAPPVVAGGSSAEQREEPLASADGSIRSPSPVEATPPPPPPFVVSEVALDTLRTALITSTDELTVDQLEQLRAACFDTVWRGRAEWDRTAVIAELEELAHDFVDEVKALAA